MKQRLVLVLVLLSTMLSAQKLEKSIDETLYAINYPSSWKIDNTGKNGVEFYLFASPIEDNFGSNINLLIQNLEGMNIDLTKFTEISEKQITTNGKIISSELKNKGHQKYQEVIFEAHINGKDMKFYQQYFVKNTKAFIITFTALSSHYVKLEKETLAIINSFQLK